MNSPSTVSLADLSDPAPPPDPLYDWNDDGVVIARGLLPDELIDAYIACWLRENGGSTPGFDVEEGRAPKLMAYRPGGWPDCTPYMRHRELLDLCTFPPLAELLLTYIGEPAGVHLNLSGFVSTERRWHQDGYLNPPHVGDRYAAVWMALDNIDARSGPFQYVPGSHRWHRLTYEKIARVVDVRDPAWPAHTEGVLTPLVEAEIVERGARVETYVPSRGDVLLWHPRLYHQGSLAAEPGAYRPALIAHYSGINHRGDMPRAVQDLEHPWSVKLDMPAGWYFPIHDSGPTGR